MTLDEHLDRRRLPASERLAIYDALPRRQYGKPGATSRNPTLMSADQAAGLAGFVSAGEANIVRSIIRNGIPDLIKAMDAGTIPIGTADNIARQPAADQGRLLQLRLMWLNGSTLSNQVALKRSRRAPRDLLRIPNSPVEASRILWERWPAHWLRELVVAIEGRLAAQAEGRVWRKHGGANAPYDNHRRAQNAHNIASTEHAADIPLITREEARARGLKRYFTGQPCMYGHIAQRYVNSSGGCCECTRISNQRLRGAATSG